MYTLLKYLLHKECMKPEAHAPQRGMGSSVVLVKNKKGFSRSKSRFSLLTETKTSRALASGNRL